MMLSDDENEDIQNTRSEFERMMKSGMLKMKTFLQLYQVGKYSPQILKVKENDWLKKVEALYEEIQETVFNFLETNFITEEDKTNANTLLGQVTTNVTDYMQAYLTKIHETGSQVQSSAPVNLPGNSFFEPRESANSSITQTAEQAEKVSREKVVGTPDSNVSVKTELDALKKPKCWY